MYYYMQGSAADIIKVAMLNSHSVITNGSNTVDSMDGLMHNFSQIRGRCHLLLQVFYDMVITFFLDFCAYVFSKYRHVKVMILRFVGA